MEINRPLNGNGSGRSGAAHAGRFNDNPALQQEIEEIKSTEKVICLEL
jgi:hypothetical protein